MKEALGDKQPLLHQEETDFLWAYNTAKLNIKHSQVCICQTQRFHDVRHHRGQIL